MMRPVSEFPSAALRRVQVVLCDIDDTLTDHGRLTAPAYAALERLHDAGLKVVPVSGRPAGWCDLIARFWPVDAVIGENGAFWFAYDHARRRMSRFYWQTPRQRADDRRRLDNLCAQILAAVPGAAVAADQAYREADLAIDWREDVTPLPAKAVERIVGLFESAGARARVSSIHVNGWFGDYDKLSMTLHVLRERFSLDSDAVAGQVLFVGDSPNDQPMFEYFSCSVGVANVREFAAQITALPRFVTDAACGAGFAEFAEHVVRARK